MATVIGDFIPEPPRFHAMIANQPLQHHHHPRPHSHHRTHDAASPYHAAVAARRRQSSSSSSPSPSTAAATHLNRGTRTTESQPDPVRGSEQAPQILSPPASSPPVASSRPAASKNEEGGLMASEMVTASVAPSHNTAPSVTSAVPSSSGPTTNYAQQPSPTSDDFPHASHAAPPRQSVVRVRDLAHVRSLAHSDITAAGDSSMQQTKFDISAMPIGDVIEMVAALLTKITSTNDLQHDAMQRNAAHQQQANQSSETSGGSQMSPMSHSVLAFHGKNVPAITILSYLSRIHKYCPTTFEVFLSLLVYFDRMTERVNELVAKSEEARKVAARSRPAPAVHRHNRSDVTMRDSATSADSDESDSDLADDDDDDDDEEMEETSRRASSRVITVPEELPSVNGPSTYFVVDSFNIHRLIIAGVTCSSKFFSDVFYTNSRYAKVGGLPLAELNHLELQFLVLNDFRLAIPVEDLEAYATMLVEFYSREVVSQT